MKLLEKLLEKLGLKKPELKNLEVANTIKPYILNRPLTFYLIADTNHVNPNIQKKIFEYNVSICEGREKNVVVFTETFTPKHTEEEILNYDTIFPWRNTVRYWIEKKIKIFPIFPDHHYNWIDEIVNAKMFELFKSQFDKYVKDNPEINICIIDVGYSHAPYFKEKIEELFPNQKIEFIVVE